MSEELMSLHSGSQFLVLLLGRVHWWASLLGDCSYLVHSSFIGIWHYLRISTLFSLWKISCRFLFNNEVSYLSAFCTMWRDEVCMQWLIKGFFLIKDAKYLDAVAYSDLISTLVALRKRI